MSNLPPPTPGSGDSWPSYPSPPAGPAPAPGFGGPPYPGYDQGSVPPYGAYQQGGPPGQGLGVQQYAGFWQRFFAVLIDALVNLLIMVPFIVPGVFLLARALDDCFTIDDELHCPAGSVKGGPLAGAIALFVVGLIIAVWLHCRWVGRSQTPGQRALNIRVLDARTGQPIGTARAFGRYLAKSFISGLVWGLGYLWMLWDSNRQTWHDKIVGTVVVRV